MPAPMISHIVWRDAAYGLSETTISDTGLIELHALGFVLAETEESITISLEWQDGAESTRNWLAVPKNRIISRHDFRLPRPRQARVPS